MTLSFSKQTIEFFSSSQFVIDAYHAQGNVGTPSLDWTLEYLYGKDARIVEKVELGEPVKTTLSKWD
ncbi:MAG: hypothetical protein RMY28_009490 [Nostoc sp. ChiSLP01]|nr:hypothetical protein [Nostoc sp. CmiSLP01]MDZ8285212.1 hypothetical protein [Nostoc sp. ChiSLP01]